MKKLILQEFISVDGFCADRNKTTGFFDGTYNSMEKDVDEHQRKFVENIDLILLGTNTYKMFASYWPTASSNDSAVAKLMNSIPKIVFSKSLTGVQWGNHGNITQVKEDAVTHIKKLKEAGDKTMIVWGSILLAQALLKANLFDEIQLGLVPVAIGKGYSLFPEKFEQFHLKLINHKTFSGGTVLHVYKPVLQ
ncbi:MAG: dihydrofolate reductase family protein [Bacteroidota bacterium]